MSRNKHQSEKMPASAHAKLRQKQQSMRTMFLTLAPKKGKKSSLSQMHRAENPLDDCGILKMISSTSAGCWRKQHSTSDTRLRQSRDSTLNEDDYEKSRWNKKD